MGLVLKLTKTLLRAPLKLSVFLSEPFDFLLKECYSLCDDTCGNGDNTEDVYNQFKSMGLCDVHHKSLPSKCLSDDGSFVQSLTLFCQKRSEECLIQKCGKLPTA